MHNTEEPDYSNVLIDTWSQPGKRDYDRGSTPAMPILPGDITRQRQLTFNPIMQQTAGSRKPSVKRMDG